MQIKHTYDLDYCKVSLVRKRYLRSKACYRPTRSRVVLYEIDFVSNTIYLVKEAATGTRETALVAALTEFAHKLHIDLTEFYNHMHYSSDYQELIILLRTRSFK